jgi:hypothetical protein
MLLSLYNYDLYQAVLQCVLMLLLLPLIMPKQLRSNYNAAAAAIATTSY